jgi:hypothetical protein
VDVRDELLLERAEHQHGLVDRADVAATGLTPTPWRRRLGSGEWSAIAPGVWHHTARRPDCRVVHDCTDAGRVMRVDFQFPDTQLVVEVSGRLGHASDRDRAKDARRGNDLTADGWDVREFTPVDVLEDPRDVVATVSSALRGPCG